MVYCTNEDCTSDKDYERIGRHFAACGYPEIDEEDLSILKGILLGDATISCDSSNNQKMTVYSTNKEFLQHIIDVLPEWLITTEQPQLFKTEEEAQSSGESWLSDRGWDSSSYDFSRQYRIRTVRHPKFSELREWYSNDKQLPEEEKLDKTMIKYWFVCDGNTRKNADNKYSKIVCDLATPNKLNEYGEKIENTLDLDVNVNTDNGVISMDSENTEKFLSKIGDSFNGFEYKW